MTLAKQALEQLSQDPVTRRMARERADAIRLYEMDLTAIRVEGKAEGRVEGKAEGKAEILLKLIEQRFGPPSEATRARVEAATLEQLDAWSLRVLMPATLDEVLAL